MPKRYAYSLVDNDGLESTDILVQKETVLEIETGDAWRADSLEALARKISVPGKNLGETVAAYNEAVRTKQDPLGKDRVNLMFPIVKPPFWACYAGMTRHTTVGGIVINERGEVLDGDGRVIRGLYAAGEATGGVHGANRLGAYGLLDALTFGRIAGRSSTGHS